MVDERRETHRVGRAARNGDLGHVELEQLALRRIDVVAYGDGLVVVECVLRHDPQVQHPEVASQRVGYQPDFEIGDRTLVLIIKVAVFERFARGVLGVELPRGVVVAHQQLEVVDALADVGRQVEFRGRQRVADLGHLTVVEPERVGRAGIFQMQVDHAVGPSKRNFDLLPENGIKGTFGRNRHFGTESLPVSSGFAVAGVGVVACVVGYDLRAVDAASLRGHRNGVSLLLGRNCKRAGCQRSRQYRSFHRIQGCIIRTKINKSWMGSKRNRMQFGKTIRLIEVSLRHQRYFFLPNRK